MPEWISERGIGETRIALVDGNDIVETRILIHGVPVAGLRLPARLISTGPRTVARDDEGNEYLLPKGAGGVTQGAALDIVVTRSAIPGAEPWKRALAKVAEEGEGLSDTVGCSLGQLPRSWDDVIEEARSGIVRFAGGELRVSATPAMTLIDVDGWLPPDELAVLGAAEAAKASRRLDIGGSIGIDLPSSGSKAARQAAASAIDAKLPPPFERTAVNGFGFVQIVRPRRRASLIELAADRAAFEARALLRRAGGEVGAIQLVANPAVVACLETKPDWIGRLSRQVGGTVTLRAEAALAMSGAYATRA